MFKFQGFETKCTAKGSTRLFSRIVALAIPTVAALLLTSTVNAKIVYVNGAVSRSGNGSSWSSAFKYLRDAIDNTSGKDQIYIAKGYYFPDDGASGRYGDRELFFELKGQQLFGGFSGNEKSLSQRNAAANTTVLSGAIWEEEGEDAYWSMHVVVLHQSSTLDGLIVENGHASGTDSWAYPGPAFYEEGGGCYVKSGKILTLRGCTFRGHRAYSSGAAIMVAGNGGKVVASDCVFEGNSIPINYNFTRSIALGGAICGNVEAVNCRFSNNRVMAVNFIGGTSSSATGGAVSGNVKATNCQFIGNSALAFGGSGIKSVASGGAISGNVTAAGCVFSGNIAEGGEGTAISSGGAICGGTVSAVNCSFVSNAGGRGEIFETDGSGTGGGGAVYVAKGTSVLANCVFIQNTSRVRGGAIHCAKSSDKDSLLVGNCTFLNNGVAKNFKGAALSCGGIVRILNNVFWFTTTESGDFQNDNLVQVIIRGAIRNSDLKYPTPSWVAPNLMAQGEAGITPGIGADIFLVNASKTFFDREPQFVNVDDPDGADNQWGTSDDGLRLNPGSPGIMTARDHRITGTMNLLPKDTLDADGDGDLGELLPVDRAGFARVQGSYLDLGAYESGNLTNVPEIAVSLVSELSIGGAVSFGSVAKGVSVKKTFTISNTGSTSLLNLSVALTGSPAFTLKGTVPKNLKPGASATVTVTFKPTTTAKVSARMAIASNDADENPFYVNLSGSGNASGSKKTSPDPAPLVFSRFYSGLPTGGPLLATTITTTVSPSGLRYRTLTAQKSPGWGTGSHMVEVSPDLLDWYSGDNHTTILRDDASVLVVRDNTPVSSSVKRYIRLR